MQLGRTHRGAKPGGVPTGSASSRDTLGRRAAASRSPVPFARRSRGFTLVETLVVLALIAIVAAVGIPYTMETIQRTTFVSAADCAANLLRVARLQAVRQNANVGVTLDGRVIRAETGQPHAPNCQLPAVVATVGVDGWTTSGGEPVFLPNGSGTEDGAFRFGDLRGNQIEVRLAPAAVGRVEVLKFNGLVWIGRDQGGWQWQ